jgi:hypothetical protein
VGISIGIHCLCEAVTQNPLPQLFRSAVMRSDCTTLDVRAFGLAAGTVASVISAVCAVALLIAPEATRAVAGYLIHSDLSGLAVSVTWSSILTGVIGWGLIAGLAFSAAAGLYNRFSGAARAEHSKLSAHGVA